VLSTVLKFLNRDLFDPVLVTYSDERGLPLPVGISCHVLGLKGGGGLGRKLAGNFLAVLRLRRVLRKERPDIVVGMGGMSNWVLILAAKLTDRKLPIVIGEHGVGSLRYRTDRLTSNLLGWLNKSLYPLADRIIAVSYGVRDHLLKEVDVPEQKVTCIPNPVDIKRIRELSEEQVDHPWLIRMSKPVVLWVGRLEPLKGLPQLIGAFDRVLKQLDARLIVVGKGSELNATRSLVERKGLIEKVDFVGFQSNPYRYMSRCAVFAFPSLSEGFGLVLVEAMACGLPVVSADCVAGPSEVLQNGRCGILVPVGDEGALAQGILKLLTDAGLRDRLTAEALHRVADFEPSKVVASYEQLFHEVCKDRVTGEPVGHAR
jgi:glycosyltransferase involved in cell wall biosynthesis